MPFYKQKNAIGTEKMRFVREKCLSYCNKNASFQCLHTLYANNFTSEGQNRTKIKDPIL